MKAKLQAIHKETEELNKVATERLKKQKKKLAEQRKEHPPFPNKKIVQHSQFIHTSAQYAIPIQNWKDGTPFYREKFQKKSDENIHSAKDTRTIKKQLSDDEFDFIMSQRYDTATNEMPLNGGVFEVVPTHKEPLGYSHKCIWKEYW
ncbi:hypothetical protein M9Y10_022777 [Tritrichomonas musculus]|uniref:Uncharacterized protein n=1 Tax=Tritrichomonas musculus TaxID=1915356 RepID=A0ABR2KTV7_9EUKA